MNVAWLQTTGLHYDNNHCEINSQDINDYLQTLTNYSFTAKDFRTWAACRETLYRLIQATSNEQEQSQPLLKNIIGEVASILGHTPAICQECYIYPEIISVWQQNKISDWVKNHSKIIEDKDKLLLKWLEDHIVEP